MSTGKWYREGTVSFTQGQAAVTGAATLWLANARAGDLFTLTGDKFYEIESVGTNNALLLKTPYLEETGTAQSYAIVRNFTGTMQGDIAAKLSDLVLRFHGTLNELSGWLGATGGTAVLHNYEGQSFTVNTPARISQMITEVEASLVDVAAAQTAAANAANSATAAASSATAASGTLTTVQGVATTVQGLVADASASASAAAGSATTAAGHVTSANTAKTAAEAAKTAAQAAAAEAQSYVGGSVSSFNTRYGVVTLTVGDVTTALGFSPQNPAQKGAANGYAGLDGTGKVPAAQLPAPPTIPVTSVAGKSGGAVTLAKADVGLPLADNTADTDKPISTATATALAGKENTADKNAANGYAGLVGQAIRVLTTAKDYFSSLRFIGTANRVHTLPDKDGTIAMLSDITGTNSGTNTGDETNASIKSKLGITALGGVNTGDQSLAGLGGEASANKNVAGGYAGLTGFNLDFLDTSGTFKSFLTNGNSASRTYTFQNRSGTIADLGANTWAGDQNYGGYKITNVVFNNAGGGYLDKGNSGTTAQSLNFSAAVHQRLVVTGIFALSTTGWMPSGTSCMLLLELVNAASAAFTWPTINWVKGDGTYTTSFASNGVTLQASGTDWIMLWTRDGGTTVFGKVMR